MHVFIVIFGTFSEVRPFIALGLGLEQVGHVVQIASWSEHQQLVSNYGLKFVSLMEAYGSMEYVPNEEFILKRMGATAKIYREEVLKQSKQNQLESVQDNSLLKKIFCFFKDSAFFRELLLKFFLGQEYNALQVGRFRQSGEIHQCMYDRYSLALLLKKCGLDGIVQRTAITSYVPNWSNFNLDTEFDGSVYRSDSLFMEAIKTTS